MGEGRLRRLAWAAVACAACALFLSLSAWQYGRGEQKQAMLEAWQLALQDQPVDMAEALRGTTPHPVRDRLAPDPSTGWLLLDNQRRGAEVGLKAYRILRTREGAFVLADFGWMPWPSRERLPDLQVLHEPLMLSGLWVEWPGQGIALAPNPFADDSRNLPVLLAYLDRSELESWSGLVLAPGVLRVDAESAFGYIRELDPLPNTLPPEKHFGYALQWLGFAITVLVIAAVLLRRTRSTPGSHHV